MAHIISRHHAEPDPLQPPVAVTFGRKDDGAWDCTTRIADLPLPLVLALLTELAHVLAHDRAQQTAVVGVDTDWLTAVTLLGSVSRYFWTVTPADFQTPTTAG